MEKRMIGIVGGIGSYAGIDLIRKIYDFTCAVSDQDHLPVSMLSVPHKIVDRTKFLIGEIDTNPGIAIAEIINTLATSGATIIGMPCNTAHAQPIFQVIEDKLPTNCVFIHLIEEVGKYLSQNHPTIKKVGLLATTGTLSTKLYPQILKQYNIEIIEPSEALQHNFVSPAIYDNNYGIKAFSNPVKAEAKENLLRAATYLSHNGAEAIILGCTEIPLAIQEAKIGNSLIIDATSVLAKALIREAKKK